MKRMMVDQITLVGLCGTNNYYFANKKAK